MKKKVYLTLENGKVFQGYAFGADGDAAGELVFTTNVVGYDKILTDPAYYGQIVVQTFPLIGNYGIIQSELEGEKAFVAAYVVRECCDAPSNFRTEGTLDDYLKKQGVVGIYGVDTRELTRILRTDGVMKATISSKPIKDVSKIAAVEMKDAVAAVAPTQTLIYGETSTLATVAFWDFGAQESAVQSWVDAGIKVIRIPAKTTAAEILTLNVDGVILSEGPGNPEDNADAIAQIQQLIGKKPMLAVGLGMQMLALAKGGKVAKMKYGHRGGNQPVKYLPTGRVYVSSQNHGYEVVDGSVAGATVQFINVNDGSCEGFEIPAERIIAVQFAPTACSAALEANFLTEQFIQMLK